MKKSIVAEKAFAFSLEIISLYQKMKKEGEYVISKQLLRSSTSIGANIEEALAGQTKKDFISKMSIASKEARETHYWLRLLQESQLIKEDYTRYLLLGDELIKMLTAIIKTSQQKNNSN